MINHFYRMIDQQDQAELGFLRAMIDNIDSAILSVLAHRAQVVRYIREYKSLHQLDAGLSQQRQQTIDELLAFSVELYLRPVFVKALLEHLFQQSVNFLHTSPSGHAEFLKQSGDLLRSLNRTLKNLDLAFLSLLSERMQLVAQVGVFKKANQLPALAPARWEKVLVGKMTIAKKLNLNTDAIRAFYDLIHQESLNIESETQ